MKPSDGSSGDHSWRIARKGPAPPNSPHMKRLSAPSADKRTLSTPSAGKRLPAEFELPAAQTLDLFGERGDSNIRGQTRDASWRANPVWANAGSTLQERLSLGGMLDQEHKRKMPIQLTKNHLENEIAAKVAAKGRLLELPKPRKEVQEPVSHTLFIVMDTLPFTFLFDEEAHTLAHEADPFDIDIAELIRKADSSANVVIVGAPVLRRTSDRALIHPPEALREQLTEYARTELKAIPVLTPPNRHRFADWVIHPLFHYSLPSAESGLGLYDWEGYQLINETFRDAVLHRYTRGDAVWINDYKLMLLPKLLREEHPDIPIGFYLHCVFPSSEVYRILPQREDILRGVLSSNIIGFHNFAYVQHFLTTCIHVLGVECTASGIEACEDAGGTHTKVTTVPLGINLEPYKRLLSQTSTKDRIVEVREKFASKKLLVAVDRLEEKRGIRHKMMAFHKFLQKAPRWADECIFVQVVEVDDKWESMDSESGEQKMLQQVYQMVGEVNSTFGKIGHLPVHFLCQGPEDFNMVDRLALLSDANVMIDAPLRSCLSHGAHEFLCCQGEKGCGVLILSEFSGSAQSLRAAALCVNPWDTNLFADAIQEALEMEYQDRVELYRYGRRYVNEYTLKNWASNFLDELRAAERECEDERMQIPPQLDHDKPVTAMRKAKRRFIVLGFSGTLVPHSKRLQTNPALPAGLFKDLQHLAQDPNTYLIVVSSLSRETLGKMLGGIHCWIIAEAGVCYKEPAIDVWHNSVEGRETDWLESVKETMEYFTARTPGSTVVEMESSVAWKYHQTQGDHAAIQSKDLLIHLWAGPLLSAPAEVVVDKDSVTVRPSGVSKALMLEKLLNQICIDNGDENSGAKFIDSNVLAVVVGDFHMRDEDIFVTVQKFFESTDKSTAISEERKTAWESEDEGKADAAKHMEHMDLNSKTLDPTKFSYRKSDSDGRFLDWSGAPKKTPSEPDYQAEDLNSPDPFEGVHGSSETGPCEAFIFTCTVKRKATRAAYHLSDTYDVSFLLKGLARELRQSKPAAGESPPGVPKRDPHAHSHRTSTL